MKLWTTGLLGLLLTVPAGAVVYFEAEPPVAPDRAPLIRIMPTPLSQETMMKRSRELGMREAKPIRGPRGLVLQAGSLLLQRDPQGTEFFADLDRYMVGDGLKPLPDDEAQRMAMAFLEKYPGGIEMKQTFVRNVRHLMSQGQDIRSGELLPAVQEQTMVHLGRRLAEIDVLGPGDGIRLHVDNAGAVVGLHRVWRTAEILDKIVPILPYEEVKRNLLARLEREARQNDVVIRRIQFGFYSREEGLNQEYYVPVYLFTAEFVDPDMKNVGAARHIPIAAVSGNDLPEDPEPPDIPRPEGDEKRIIIKAEPPVMTPALPLLKVVENVLTPDVFSRRAVALGIDPSSPPSENPRGLVLQDEKNMLVLFQDRWGTESFAKLDRLFNEPPAAQPITDAAAIKAAQTWIGQNGGVNPELLGAPVVRRLRSAGFDTMKQEPERPSENEVIVQFPMVLPDLQGVPVPVIGDGAFFNVFVNAAGDVNGHHRVMRSVEKLDTVLEMRPFSMIFDMFKRNLMAEMGRSIAEVRAIRFGYFARPEGFRQGLLLPAVQFEVALINPDDGEVTAIRRLVVPASDELEPLEDESEQDLPPDMPDSREVNELPIAFGDISGNGQVGVEDVILAIQVGGGFVDGASLSPAQFAAGDVVPASIALGDGSVRLNDAQRILRAIMGLDELN